MVSLRDLLQPDNLKIDVFFCAILLNQLLSKLPGGEGNCSFNLYCELYLFLNNVLFTIMSIKNSIYKFKQAN